MNTKIFSYFDGNEEVWGDPADILSQLTAALDGNPNAVILATQPPTDQQGNPVEPSPFQVEAIERANQRLLAAIRIAFQMPFDRSLSSNPDGRGATRDECFAALERYQEWLEQKKTSGAGGQPSAPPSGETVSG